VVVDPDAVGRLVQVRRLERSAQHPADDFRQQQADDEEDQGA